jgi:general secretion pathway protein I
MILRSTNWVSADTALRRASLSTKARRGITLMEVLVALVILLFSCIAIYQLVSMGTDRAIDVKYYARASMLCQSKLEELKFGAEPLTGGGPTAFKEDGDADYQYEIHVENGEIDGLKKVRVTVKREKTDGRTVEVSLGRLVLDPTFRGTTFDKLNTSSSGGTTGGQMP